MVAGAFSPDEGPSRDTSFKVQRAASNLSLKPPQETSEDDDIANAVLRSTHDDLRDVRAAIRILIKDCDNLG